MDTIVKPETDGKLSITVYRIPTHTDQCLQQDSHHHLSATYSVINAPTHRTKTVCNNPELLQKEMEHHRKALTNCKYPKWVALDKMDKRLTRSSSEINGGANRQGTAGTQLVTNEAKTKSHILIPYTQGLCKSIKKICGRYIIQTHFKGNSTIKNLLVSPKDKDPMVNKSWAIYWFQCGDLSCDDECIGKTSSTIGGRFKEHLKETSPMHHHTITQAILPLNTTSKIIGREGLA